MIRAITGLPIVKQASIEMSDERSLLDRKLKHWRIEKESTDSSVVKYG